PYVALAVDVLAAPLFSCSVNACARAERQESGVPSSINAWLN
ncbi:MAG: hypothetical protein HW386_1540, partial [Gammaproteobacteria bacterium]|nr:hypothetical protein [Gammaproteobacteria bacterium]